MARSVLALLLATMLSGCVVHALALGGLDGHYDPRPSLGCGNCITEQQLARQLDQQRTHPRTLLAADANHVHVDRERTIRTRATYEGGHFMLIGRPSRSREHAVLSLRPLTKLGPEPCGVRLYRDDSELTVRGVQRKSDRELLVLLDVAALRELGRSRRLAGRACGAEFSFGTAARATVEEFERRFQDEVAGRHDD